MKGTIVFSKEESHFLVIASNLVAVINGGIQRLVSKNEMIIMNATDSYDPDYPNENNFT